MYPLAERIRSLTGATTTEVSAYEMADAMLTSRVRLVDLPLLWHPRIGPSGTQYVYAEVDGGGRVFEHSTDLAPATGTQLVNSLGVAVSGWTLSENGQVDFTADQSSSGTLYLTAYAYDLDRACAEVMDRRISTRLEQHDFQDGDQRFNVSQVVAQMEAKRDKFKSGMLPEVATRQRWDELPGDVRRQARSRGGNDL